MAGDAAENKMCGVALEAVGVRSLFSNDTTPLLVLPQYCQLI